MQSFTSDAQHDRRRIRSWFAAVLVLGIATFAFSFWAVKAYSAKLDPAQADLLSNLGTAGVTLVFAALVGGFVKELFDALSRARIREEEDTQFVRNILADIKSVYDIVEQARLLIEAHKSAKTYGEQMRKLPEAVVILHNIRRALRPDVDGIGAEIMPQLICCSAFLKALLREFQENYLEASVLQSQYEARKKHHMDMIEEGRSPAPFDTTDHPVWTYLEALPELTSLRAPDDDTFALYRLRFLNHIDTASYRLRCRLPGGQTSEANGSESNLKKHAQSIAFFKRIDDGTDSLSVAEQMRDGKDDETPDVQAPEVPLTAEPRVTKGQWQLASAFYPPRRV